MSQKQNSRGVLISREKLVLESGLIREVVVWDIPKTSCYPDGIRYRLALVNSVTSTVLVLFDNHIPKGHHKHIRNRETPYSFLSLSKLIEDFLSECKVAEEMFNENKKN